MSDPANFDNIKQQLHTFLKPAFGGIEIDVSHSPRWDRLALTLTHADFARWLPEQRFKKIVQRIPPEFFEEHLAGAVWFELAPGQTQDDLLKARRSEDVADDEPKLARALFDKTFFDALKTALGESPIETCGGDFTETNQVLAKVGLDGDGQQDTCLMFILNQAYCDCEVLLAAGPALAQRYDSS